MNQPSEYFRKTFSIKTEPKTDESFVVIKGDVRFSVLTSKLLRVEIDKSGVFNNEPTQAVLFRSFAKPEFKIVENGSVVKICTKDVIFSFDTKTKKMLSIALKDGRTVTDFKKGNLKGTYRTLDMVNGSTGLGDGLMSRDGVSVVDDTNTCIIADDGTIKERRKMQSDKYYFAYGFDYRGCLRDFFSLTGKVPLVPRYCLGNWWSRYRAYTQQEYVDLMNNFLEREIPITVATIDMDWHWVDVLKRFGDDARFKFKSIIPRYLTEYFQSLGWTGYSWNTELFPDYKGLLKWLNDKNFRVTVNLHPAQGVRPFEDMYAEMAEAMGIDPKTKQHIRFDIADPKFIEAYFKVLHKPYEKDGVTFWWIDWQQEKTTGIKGLDPLWALNHYHTLAASEDNKRPLILSRFAEVGSHRYPLGFSGDTFITWKSLEFQPYFTATATNIGYTWWSHDIGGHQMGSRNDDLYARWVQYGLYSPIMRLHSTKDDFMGKEPWKYSYAANEAAVNALRERHTMIPYIYSINYKTHKDGLALVEPMYYEYPESREAYEVPDQYFFGTELMVRPITSPLNKTTNLAGEKVWLPKGRWTDWYNGRIYEGGRFVTMYRGIESIPVLAKEGAIVPLSANDRTNDWSNPDKMVVRIFRGTNSFELYEDDGETFEYENGAYAITKMSVREAGKDVAFTIAKAKGDLSVIPEKRDYKLIFDDISGAEEITVKVGGKKNNADITSFRGKTTIELKDVAPTDEVYIEFKAITPRVNGDRKAEIVDIISKFQMTTVYKRANFELFAKDITKPLLIRDEAIRGPIEEILGM